MAWNVRSAIDLLDLKCIGIAALSVNRSCGKNRIATQGHSHSMAVFRLCRYVVVTGILAFEM